jgi:hypothetical protein
VVHYLRATSQRHNDVGSMLLATCKRLLDASSVADHQHIYIPLADERQDDPLQAGDSYSNEESAKSIWSRQLGRTEHPQTNTGVKYESHVPGKANRLSTSKPPFRVFCFRDTRFFFDHSKHKYTSANCTRPRNRYSVRNTRSSGAATLSKRNISFYLSCLFFSQTRSKSSLSRCFVKQKENPCLLNWRSCLRLIYPFTRLLSSPRCPGTRRRRRSRCQHVNIRRP